MSSHAKTRTSCNEGGDLRVKTNEGDTFITATQRPDGTWRKARKVKEGYIPQDEQPKYQNRMQAEANMRNSTMAVGLTPRDMSSISTRKPAISAITNSNICVTPKDHMQKKIDLVRKKIEDIEAMEVKVSTGQLVPQPNQVKKMARKQEYIDEIDKLEDLFRKL